MKQLDTINEIKRDYQASAAFQFLLANNKGLRQEIGELTSQVAELQHALRNIEPTYETNKEFERKVNYANMVANKQEQAIQIRSLNATVHRLRIDNDRLFHRICKLEEEKLKSGETTK